MHLDNKKLVNKYLDAYEKLIKSHKLPQRQFALEAHTAVGTPLTTEQKQEADAIDVIRTKCTRKAEKQCRKLKMGMVDFSPDIALPLREIIFWDIAIRRRKLRTSEDAMGKVSPKLWKRLKKRAQIHGPIGHMTLEELYEKRKEAKAKYKQAKKNHKKLSIKFIETFDPKEREGLKRTEKQRQLGSKMGEKGNRQGNVKKCHKGRPSRTQSTPPNKASRQCCLKLTVRRPELRTTPCS